MVRLAEGEIEREGKRVLRKLASPGAILASHDTGYALMIPARTGVKPRLRIAAELFDAFRSRGWIESRGGEKNFILSEAGLFWLRRVFADDNPFAAQHRLERRSEIVDARGHLQSVSINDGESPLGWLMRRRGSDGRTLIAKHQYDAGERLRKDFTLAQLSPRLGVDLSAPVVAGRRGAKAHDLPETVIAAKQRFARAIAAVGPGLSDIVIDICCHLIGLESAERQKGWPQRSAKVVLQIALDRLAAHYGLGVVVGTGSRLRSWQAPEDASAAQKS